MTVSRSNNPILVSDLSGAARTINGGRLSETMVPSFMVNGSGTLTVSNAVNNLNLTNFGGTLAAAVRTIYGSLILGENVTTASTTRTTALAATSGEHFIETNGATVKFPIQIGAGSNPSSAVIKLADHLTMANSRTLSVSRGEFDANDKNLSIGTFLSNSANSPKISMKSGTWTLTGDSASIWFVISSAGTVVDAGTSTIRLTGTLTANRDFAGGGKTYYNFENATNGSFAVVITGSNTFNNFKINPGRTQLFTAGTTTTVSQFDAVGTSDDGIVINSNTTSNHTLTKTGGGVIGGDYLTITRSTATPTNTWYAGANSTDGGNNTVPGWIFAAAPIVPNPPTDLEIVNLILDQYINSSRPEFTFNISDDDEEDEVRYHIQIATDEDFNDLIVDYISDLGEQGQRSFQVSQGSGEYVDDIGEEGQDLSEGDYYWRVSGIDEDDFNGEWTEGDAFTVDFTPPSAPGIPETLSPTYLLSQLWTWLAADDEGSGIAGYAWSVFNVADPLDPILVGSGTTPFDVLEAITNLGVGAYEFFVKAIDNADNEGPESQGSLIVQATPGPTSSPSSPSSSSSSKSSAPSCGDSKPIGVPDLFQITTTSNTATVYFAPISGTTTYFISYSTNNSAEDYGVEAALSSDGVQAYTVGSLQSGATYYFKVRGQNGCMTGDWSPVKSATTIGGASSLFSPIFQQPGLNITDMTIETPQSDDEETEEVEAHDVLIKVLHNGQGLGGVDVELHSNPRYGTTDENGEVLFAGVEKGEHTLYIAYEDYRAEQKLNVDGGTKEFNVSIEVELNEGGFSNQALIVIAALTGIILFLIFILLKKRRSKKNQ